MVDRTKRRSRRVHDDRVMAELNDVLGSGFNLRLSKALRSRVALFVEGQDMRILKNLARTVGANLVSQERGLTVVPMGGASNRRLASSFGWINTTLLDSAVKVSVVMDRDYLTDSAVDELIREFSSAGVSAHIWARKELESYLLANTALARLSGLPFEDVDKILAETVDSLRDKVLSRHLANKIEQEKGSGKSVVTVNDECLKAFVKAWSDHEWRLTSVPAKDVLSGVNARIQEAGGKAVSARNLSSRMLSHEIPIEMREFLVRINAMLA